MKNKKQILKEVKFHNDKMNSCIFEFHKIYDSEHRVAKVLFKNPELKEELEDRIGTNIPKGAELSSVPDLDTELYKDHMKIIDPLKPQEKPFE